MTEYPADILEKALSVRNSMCMDCECKFVASCVCLDNVAQAIMDERERWRDKIEGLEADLDSAVEVAFNRGATDWTRLNYPRQYERLAAAIRSGGE